MKATTGITGLPVIPESRKILIALYQKTLQEIRTIPEGVYYRSMVEASTLDKLQTCLDHEEVETIEKKYAPLQIEEMIAMAEDELGLIPMMREFRPWEVPPGTKIPVICIDDADSPIFEDLKHMIDDKYVIDDNI